jgi:heparan-alpha-glucosaminide N-acetyltransferase
MAGSNRIYSIDIMRGFNLILMLFVNDLFVEGVPAWLGHRPSNFDGIGLVDWVFPGFMFMVGMSIPYALGNRMMKGEGRFIPSACGGDRIGCMGADNGRCAARIT